MEADDGFVRIGEVRRTTVAAVGSDGGEVLGVEARPEDRRPAQEAAIGGGERGRCGP